MLTKTIYFLLASFTSSHNILNHFKGIINPTGNETPGKILESIIPAVSKMLAQPLIHLCSHILLDSRSIKLSVLVASSWDSLCQQTFHPILLRTNYRRCHSWPFFANNRTMLTAVIWNLDNILFSGSLPNVASSKF